MRMIPIAFRKQTNDHVIGAGLTMGRHRKPTQTKRKFSLFAIFAGVMVGGVSSPFLHAQENIAFTENWNAERGGTNEEEESAEEDTDSGDDSSSDQGDSQTEDSGEDDQNTYGGPADLAERTGMPIEEDIIRCCCCCES